MSMSHYSLLPAQLSVPPLSSAGEVGCWLAVDQRIMEEYGHWLVSLEVFFSDNKLQVIGLVPKVL